MNNLESNNNYLKISLWALKIYYLTSKFHTISKLISGIILENAGIVNSAITALIINSVIKLYQNPESTNDFYKTTVIFIIFNIFLTASRILNQYSTSLIRLKMRFKPKTLLYEKLEEMGLAGLEDPEILNKITRFTDNQWIYNTLLENISVLIGVILTGTSAFIILANKTPLILPIIIIVSLPRFILNRRFTKKIWHLERDNTIKNRRADGNVGYIINSSTFKEVTLMGGYNYLRKIYEDFTDSFITSNLKIRIPWSSLIFAFRALDTIYLIIGIFLILNLLVTKQISIGEVTFLLTTIRIFAEEVGSAVGLYTDVTEALLRLNDSYELLNFKSKNLDGSIRLGKLNISPIIELKNVSFKYPGSEKYIIKNLNLKINSGERIAIVGSNGAGKTTLIKLLTKLYRINEGELLINNVNINNLEIKSWYNNIGVLFQDYNTYEHLSVRENIALGRIEKTIDDKKIWEAIVNADAEEFIKSYPMKLDQILSEKYSGGIRPSTGQWQKIAIARFFYRDSPLLILDEPTASIDAVAEANIFNRIYKFIENKTVIIISHRFSTVRNANRIIVFEGGEIIEEGTHEELLSLGGKYFNAFNLQAKGYLS